MHGVRAQLGVIVPSTNTTIEPEFHHFAPPGVASFATRVPVAETENEDEKVATVVAMRDRLPAAAAELAGLQPNVVAFACTSASFLGGRDVDALTCERLTAITEVPSFTTSTAVVAALRSVGARRLAVVTPYVQPLADGACAYLEQSGFEVVARADMGLLSNLDKGRLPADASARLARTVDVSRADAVLISCTNWRTLDHADALERDLGLPLVTSNLATLWAALVLAGVEGPFVPRVRLMDCDASLLPDHVFPTIARARTTHATAAAVSTAAAHQANR